MKVCVVIPCFNEENRLCKESFISFANLNEEINFLFVNDGSTDKTTEVLSSIEKSSSKCSFFELPKNLGKAEAVRLGMMRAYSHDYTHIGYLDADLTISLEKVKRMLILLEEKNLEFIFASRAKRFKNKKNINRTRQTLGFVFSNISKSVLGLSVQDTQCGAKFFKSSIVPILFRDPFLSRWIFDVEIFFRFKAYFGKQVSHCFYEFPLLLWEDNASSKIKLGDYLKVPYQIIRIFIKYRYSKNISEKKTTEDVSVEPDQMAG